MEQQLIYGNNCSADIRRLFQQNNWSNVLLVTGKKSYETSGSKQFIDECLSGLEVSTIRFCEFSNNPNISDLRKGLESFGTFKPSVIIAIGGGSVLDMSKLLRFCLTHDGEIFSGKYEQKEIFIPLIAIPTTAGTGAEATRFAVLYDENGKKHSIQDDDILPDYAVVNPRLTYGQSPYITACTGFDALAQAIESYWNKNATKESDEYAKKAIDLIYPYLQDAVIQPTDEVRNKMSKGAYWAGRAINITKTTAPHAFSYPFTSVYGIPHGHAVSIVFPAIAEFNMQKGSISDTKIAYLKSTFGETDDIKKYIESIGLNLPEKDYEIDMILEGISLERLANNPADISKQEAVKLIQKSLYADSY